MTVKTDGRYGEAHSILGRFGAYDIENRYAGRSTTVSPSVAPGVSAWGEGTVNPHEPKSDQPWEEEARLQKVGREYEDSRSGYGSGFTSKGTSDTGLTNTSPIGGGSWVEGDEYEIAGWESYPRTITASSATAASCAEQPDGPAEQRR